MPHKFYKFRILLDEGMSPRSKFPRLNGRFNVKHIVSDFNKGGVSDLAIYSIAKKQKRIVVTFNIKHFVKFAKKSKDSGVIGASTNLTTDQLDKKLTALLIRSKRSDLYGRLQKISHEAHA